MAFPQAAAVFLCIQVTMVAKVNAEYRDNIPRMPISTQQFSPSEWEKVIQNLRPRADNPHARPIVQPFGAGKLSTAIRPQIVGGVNAYLGQFPWQALVYINENQLCGGSLILQNWVLTAAHCIGQYYNIYLGTISQTARSVGHVHVWTNQTFKHGQYDSSYLNNDIALIKLPIYVTLSDSIKLIKLPPLSDANATFEGIVATVSGFGKTSDGDPPSNTQRFVNLTVISNAQCAEAYGTNVVKHFTLCTLQSGMATCPGDSGGPLVYKDSTNTWVQIGVVSFGSGNGCLEGPSGYARTASYLDWISNTTFNSSGVNITFPSTTSPTTTTITSTTTTENIPTTSSTSTITSSTQETSTTDSTTTVSSTTVTGGSASETTTKPITTKKTTTIKRSPIRPLNCETYNFATMSKCCAVTPNKLVVAEKGDRTCGVNAIALKIFNSYFLNKQQISSLDFAFDFSNTKTLKAHGKDAKFVNCYLEEKGVIVEDELDIELMLKLLSANQERIWRRKVSESIYECYKILSPFDEIPLFVEGNHEHDGGPTILLQCIQFNLIQACEEPKKDRKCTKDYDSFNYCKRNIFNNIIEPERLSANVGTKKRVLKLRKGTSIAKSTDKKLAAASKKSQKVVVKTKAKSVL